MLVKNNSKNIEHLKIKSKLGITNKKNHNTFYLEGNVFVIPEDDCDDFVEIMNKVEINCKNYLKNSLLKNDFLSRNFISNFKICSNRMKKNKKTYLSFQYHFKQKNDTNEKILTVKEKNYHFFSDLLNEIEKQLLFYNIRVI